jgi:hypothetical protein
LVPKTVDKNNLRQDHLFWLTVCGHDFEEELEGIYGSVWSEKGKG